MSGRPDFLIKLRTPWGEARVVGQAHVGLGSHSSHENWGTHSKCHVSTTAQSGGGGRGWHIPPSFTPSPSQVCAMGQVCVYTHSNISKSKYIPEKAMATHSSTLAWKIPWMAEPDRLQSTGVTKSQTRLSDFTFTFHFHALEKEMATHSSVLAWRIPGTVEPGGLPSMGSHRVRHD